MDNRIEAREESIKLLQHFKKSKLSIRDYLEQQTIEVEAEIDTLEAQIQRFKKEIENISKMEEE